VSGGKPATAADLARGRAASSSSNESDSLLPANAVDGKATTRWSSGKYLPAGQWWQVDLGAAKTVAKVTVDWEKAYAPRYEIQTSVDGSTWSTAAAASATKAGAKTTTFSARQARFVRVTSLERAPGKSNVSFFDVRVFSR
jgi:hypothetical protein